MFSYTLKSKTKILVTGARGLIGRLLIASLESQQYEVYGIDRIEEGLPSPRFLMSEDTTNPILKKKAVKNGFVADVTKKGELEAVFKKIGRIDIVIHLASLLENQEPDLIKAVNVEGTENIFKLCAKYRVRRVILGSSLMVIWDKLTREEPYRQILEGNYSFPVGKLVKIDENDNIAESQYGINPSVVAYKNSKIEQEKIALQWSSLANLYVIAARFGGVTTNNRPKNTIDTFLWLSFRDLCDFFNKAIEYLLKANQDQGVFQPYYVCSRSPIVSVEKASKDLGYKPQDGIFYPGDETENQPVKILCKL